MVLLSKREYDELVQKATAVDLLAEQKAEEMKKRIKSDLIEACGRGRLRDPQEIFGKLREILGHY